MGSWLATACVTLGFLGGVGAGFCWGYIAGLNRRGRE